MTDDIVREPREIRLVQALIGWPTLAVVLISVVAFGANRPVAATLLSVAVFTLFTLQIVLDLVRGIPFSARLIWPPAILFLGALSWAVVQITPGIPTALAHPVWNLVADGSPRISGDPLAGQQHIMRLATYAMVFWIAVRSAANADRAIWFLATVAMFSAWLAGFGIWAVWGGENPILGDNASNVVSATFLNRNSYVTYGIFGVIANLAMYLHMATSNTSEDPHRGRALRNFLERFFSGGWVFGLGFLLCLAAVVLTQSRAGGVAVIVALITFMSVYRRGGGMNILLILTVLAIFGFVAAALTTGLTDRLLATDAEEIRFVVYPAVVEGILARPYLGHGLGSFQDTFREFVPLSVANFDWDLAHNSYLENTFELGIPAALAFYLALIWIALVTLRGCIIRRRHRSFACVSLACITAAGFHSVFDFSLQMPATAALFALILGMGWAQSFRRISQEPR